MYQKPPWKRVLYEKQPYKDTYYDPIKFFDGVKVVTPQQNRPGNLTFFIRYWQLFLDTTIVSQQISAVSFFLTMHRYLIYHKISFMEIMAINLCLVLNGLLLYAFCYSSCPSNLWNYLKISILFIVCARVVAPLLQTLTSSFSEDTIYALAITLSTIHLVFHDYSHSSQDQDYKNCQNTSSTTSSHTFSNSLRNHEAFELEQGSSKLFPTLSLNTAIFTAIILASRLDQPNTVVAYIILAVIAFALFPLVMKQIKAYSILLHLTLALIQWLLTGYCLYNLSEDRVLFVVYELLVVLVWLSSPCWLLIMYSYQKSFRGAWDIVDL